MDSLQVCRAFDKEIKISEVWTCIQDKNIIFPTLQRCSKYFFIKVNSFSHDSCLLVQIPHLYSDINTRPDVLPYAKDGIWLVQNIILNKCGGHILIVFSLSNKIPAKLWSIPVPHPSRDPLLMEIRIQKLLKKNIK